MCNIIFTLHQHCSHEQYQNTFPCHVIRGCAPSDTMVLDQAVFLFDTKKRPAYFDESPCKKLKLKRPEQSLCDSCKKKQPRPKAEMVGKGKEVLGRGLSSPFSSPAVVPSPSSAGIVDSPSTPDVDLESAQNTTLVSLLRVSRLGPGPNDSPASMLRDDFSFEASPLSSQEKQRMGSSDS